MSHFSIDDLCPLSPNAYFSALLLSSRQNSTIWRINQLKIIKKIAEQINYSSLCPSRSLIEEFQGFRGESLIDFVVNWEDILPLSSGLWVFETPRLRRLLRSFEVCRILCVSKTNLVLVQHFVYISIQSICIIKLDFITYNIRIMKENFNDSFNTFLPLHLYLNCTILWNFKKLKYL